MSLATRKVEKERNGKRSSPGLNLGHAHNKHSPAPGGAAPPGAVNRSAKLSSFSEGVGKKTTKTEPRIKNQNLTGGFEFSPRCGHFRTVGRVFYQADVGVGKDALISWGNVRIRLGSVRISWAVVRVSWGKVRIS